jgi:aminodeoxyfutalosine synthase
MTLSAVAERVARGDSLTDGDARAILATHDLIAVATLADEVRRQMRGVATTFVRVMDVHADAVPKRLPAGVSAGEFRIIGQPVSQEAAVAAVRAVSALAGETPVTGFSLAHLLALTPSIGALTTFCAALTAAGLSAVADVPLDRVDDIEDAVAAARDGGLAILRLTVDAVAEDQRVAVIEQARTLHQRCGGFRSFAPLPRILSASAPTTGYDDVKHVALARLMLRDIESIQVDWALYGPKLAQVALTMGADDVDSVAAFAAENLGHRRSALEEIQRNIRAASLEPVERDGLFRAVGA